MERFWYAMIALGFVVVWTFLSLLPGPGSEPWPTLPAFIPATQLADPQQEVTSNFHDIGYENAWIQFKDAKERLVQVQTMESKIAIVFRVKKREDMKRYNEGWIAPVTFLCRQNRIDCDIGSQVKTYIGNLEVQPTIWKTSGKNTKLKIAPQ